ncbi:hypothetical protein [Amniculibacterium sp. G2-70]|uniref:hypothetical protein n=1 Tax=Amniculibacterium sp. G2-70 TaxID=2767188 RepID=UPI0016548924|nr:hypothetical protein [Amniculibacterium sp. G2-70]
MKRFFNYIIFHIYTFQKRVGNEDIFPISISMILTILACFLFYIIDIILFVYYDSEIIKLSKIQIILIMAVIFMPIYLYIRKKHYLEYNFKESKKGYFYFIFLVVIIYTMFVYFANKSRNKIFEEQGYTKEQIENGGKKPFNPNEKPKSLEGDIRLWCNLPILSNTQK